MKSSNIGGQAVIEGVMMKNKDRYAVAVRKPDGEIEVTTDTYKSVVGKYTALTKLPFVRGIFNFVGCLIFMGLYFVLPKSLYPYIGMIGGIGVGYSAGYAWQTAFNTFGALSIAAGLFGMPYAVALRIGLNAAGAAYTWLCDKVLERIHSAVQAKNVSVAE